MYKNTRKKAIKLIYKQPLFTLDKSELMSLISNIEKDLLAQKEDKRDCFNCWHADECAFCEDGSDYCPLEKRLNKPKQEESKDIEFEEIEEIEQSEVNRRGLNYRDRCINSLIHNQEKLISLTKRK